MEHSDNEGCCVWSILIMVLCVEHSGNEGVEHSDNEGCCVWSIMIITIMEICKAPTLWLKELNKHSIIHLMYIEMEMLSVIKMYIKRKERKKANT